jgi:hypothetical protein
VTIEEATGSWVRRGVRLGVSIPWALFGFPLLLLYAYLLLYWLPAVRGPDAELCDLPQWGHLCWRPEQRTFWILGATAAGSMAACLVLMLVRLRTEGRWWPWPVAAAGFAVAATLAIQQIP